MALNLPKEIAFSHFKILTVLEGHYRADPQMGVTCEALFDDVCDHLNNNELVAGLKYLTLNEYIDSHRVGDSSKWTMYYSASSLTPVILDEVMSRRIDVVGGKKKNKPTTSVEAYRACEECGRLRYVTRKLICGQRVYLCRDCLCKDQVIPELSRGLGPGALLLEA